MKTNARIEMHRSISSDVDTYYITQYTFKSLNEVHFFTFYERPEPDSDVHKSLTAIFKIKLKKS